MSLLDGKVAIVTGGGAGIGRQHSLQLAKEGAKVVVNDLGGTRDGTGGSDAAAAKVVEEIKKMGGQAVPNFDSVTTVAGGKNILKTALDAFGKVDILINNAGILRDKSFANMTEEMWDAVMAVHVKALFCVTQPVFVHMKDRGGPGRIINTSSTSGLFGNFGQANYAAAKAGVAGFTRVMALEGKKYNVTVNALVPVAFTRLTEDLPAFKTPGADKELDPSLISPVIVWLCSDEAADVTGKFFLVKGNTVELVFVDRKPIADKPTKDGPWKPQDIGAKIKDVLKDFQQKTKGF
jgi:NAD(P)-dependent dehydrogenase (short-subunit alcohol dehydrogenase family)